MLLSNLQNLGKQDVCLKHHAPAKGLFLDSFGVTL